MSKLIMLVGLPASGKSTYAKDLSIKESAVILSSDTIREELYDNINDTEHNSEVFQELHKRAKENLKQGKNVIYDATNVNSRRRKGFLSQLKGKSYNNIEKICYYIATPFKTCIQNNAKRNRQIPLEIIEKMYKTFQVPMYHEGWDQIHIISEKEKNYFLSRYSNSKKILEEIIINDIEYMDLFNAPYLEEKFKDIYELPHDNSYHNFSVSRHTFYVYKYILENYNKEDKLIMLWTGLLHDIGKGFCKNFKDGKNYANFIGHDNVSSQLATTILKSMGYDDFFTTQITTLIQLHMRLSWNNEDINIKDNNKLFKLVGQDVFDKLKLLRIADIQAK